MSDGKNDHPCRLAMKGKCIIGSKAVSRNVFIGDVNLGSLIWEAASGAL